MSTRKPRYDETVHAERGRAIYDAQVRPLVEAENRGKVVAIDIDTADYEVDETTLAAADRLLARHPDAQLWFVRIGYPGVHRFGFQRRTKSA
jgi:hypothetical protein